MNDQSNNPSEDADRNNSSPAPFHPIITETPDGRRTIQLQPGIRIHHHPPSLANPNANGSESGASNGAGSSTNSNPSRVPLLSFRRPDGQMMVLRPGQSANFMHRPRGPGPLRQGQAMGPRHGRDSANVQRNNAGTDRDGTRQGGDSSSASNTTSSGQDATRTRSSDADDDSNANTSTENNNASNDSPEDTPANQTNNPRVRARFTATLASPHQLTVPPPLTEEPLPIPDTNNGSTSNEDEMRDFECPICFDVIETPATCGSCDNRFCLKCLQRSLNNDQNNEEAVANSATANTVHPLKCPCCRKTFTSPSLDSEFSQRMAASSITKACPHPNCPQQKIPLNQIKQHERTCEYQRVRCKYHPYGCKWSGAMKDVADHYRIGCSYDKVSGLVQEFRELKFQRSRESHALENMIARQNHQISEMRRNMGRNQQRQQQQLQFWSIPSLMLEMTTFPSRFFQYIAWWYPLCGSADARARLSNILYLLPSSLWVVKIGKVGLKKAASLLNERNWNSPENTMVLFEAQLTFSIVSLGLICMACILLDGGGPRKWAETDIIIGSFSRSRSFIRDKVAICSFFVHFFATTLENELTGHKGSALLFAQLIVTFFPPIIATMLGHAQALGLGSDSPHGKMKDVVLFGIKYAALCMITPSAELAFDGMLLLNSCIRQSKIDSQFVRFLKSDLIFPDIPVSVYVLVGSIRMSMILKPIHDEQQMELRRVFQHPVDMFCAGTCLLMIHSLMFALDYFGSRRGTNIALNALRPVSNGAELSKTNFVGLACFFVWASAVVSIAIV